MSGIFSNRSAMQQTQIGLPANPAKPQESFHWKYSSVRWSGVRWGSILDPFISAPLKFLAISSKNEFDY